MVSTPTHTPESRNPNPETRNPEQALIGGASGQLQKAKVNLEVKVNLMRNPIRFKTLHSPSPRPEVEGF
jgi:hypothetical protein